jgi:hypothetical protein
MRRLLTNHAGALTSKSVKDVTVDDIEAALRPLLLRSRDQFKRTQAAISQVFDFAMSHEHCESNPADWRRLKYRFPNHRPVVKIKSVWQLCTIAKTSDAVWSTDGKRPISNKAIYLYLTRTLGLTVTLHGFRSAFRDWAGNEQSPTPAPSPRRPSIRRSASAAGAPTA